MALLTSVLGNWSSSFVCEMWRVGCQNAGSFPWAMGRLGAACGRIGSTASSHSCVKRLKHF